jgi:hypothetical protein
VTRSKGLLGASLMLVAFASTPALAQDRPFVFSLTTAPQSARAQVRFDYDVGLGEQTFRASAANGPEHRVGVQATVGRWTLVGRFGVSSTEADYATSQQGEVLFSVLKPNASGLALAVGGGWLHEAGGVDVALMRVTAGREAPTWRLHGNFLLQKPLAEGRDALDVITSAGWARKFGQSVSVGAEAIGEDLEGFWEAAEAEGGARLLAGPSLHIAPPGRHWQLSLVGGPTFHPTNSNRSTDALRDLPARGYAFKMSFSASF